MIRGLILSALIVLVVMGLRYLFLTNQSRELHRLSKKFSVDYSLGAASQAILTMVVLGDSTSVGVGASSLETTYAYQVANGLASAHNVRVINLAQSGARLCDVLTKQLPRVQPLQPDILLISIGANDATHFTPSDQFLEELNQIKAGLPAVTTLWATTPNMLAVPALAPVLGHLVQQVADRQNQALTTVFGSSEVRIVPLVTRGRLDARVKPSLYAPDRFHPSDPGYQIWSALFSAALKEKPII